MCGFSISGETTERELKRGVENLYETFWRPVLELIKLGYLTYTEAMNIDQESLYQLWYSASKLEKSFSSKGGGIDVG